MSGRVVIVGAGQAGAQVAISLRQQKFEGEVVLLGEEPVPPYQRPPLSKKYLMGELDRERTHLRRAGFYEKSAIELLCDARVDAITPGERVVRSAGGQRLDYDALVLCTGTRARRLGLPGEELAGVLHLRTLADSDRIRAAARPGARAVIVGGGYIGLEVAASLAKAGCRTIVLEVLDRVMSRVVAPEVAAFFAAEHRRRGVDVRTGSAVAAFEGDHAVREVVTADGERLPADLVVVGVGAVPNDELARHAGLAVGDGVVVDEVGRTSDPAIFAAGDVTWHPSPLFGRRVRLESVHNAQAQGKVVARAIAGDPAPYAEVPWFWSDQYDLKLQIAGLSAPGVDTVLRGDPATRSFACLHLVDDRLVAIDTVNRGADVLAAKPLIHDNVRIDPARARDPDVALASFLPEALRRSRQPA